MAKNIYGKLSTEQVEKIENDIAEEKRPDLGDKEPSEDNMVEAATDMADAENESRECYETINMAFEELDNLSEANKFVTKVSDEDALPSEIAAANAVATEALKACSRRLGLQLEEKYTMSHESFKETDGNLELAREGVGDAIKSVVNGIKQFFLKAWDLLKKVVNKILEFLHLKAKSADDAAEKAEEKVKEANEELKQTKEELSNEKSPEVNEVLKHGEAVAKDGAVSMVKATESTNALILSIDNAISKSTAPEDADKLKEMAAGSKCFLSKATEKTIAGCKVLKEYLTEKIEKANAAFDEISKSRSEILKDAGLEKDIRKLSQDAGLKESADIKALYDILTLCKVEDVKSFPDMAKNVSERLSKLNSSFDTNMKDADNAIRELMDNSSKYKEKLDNANSVEMSYSFVDRIRDTHSEALNEYFTRDRFDKTPDDLAKRLQDMGLKNSTPVVKSVDADGSAHLGVLWISNNPEKYTKVVNDLDETMKFNRSYLMQVQKALWTMSANTGKYVKGSLDPAIQAFNKLKSDSETLSNKARVYINYLDKASPNENSHLAIFKQHTKAYVALMRSFQNMVTIYARTLNAAQSLAQVYCRHREDVAEVTKLSARFARAIAKLK